MRAWIAALGIGACLTATTAGAQDAPSVSEMDDLRQAYALLSTGEYEAATAAYTLIAGLAPSATAQQAAREGAAAARVASLRAEVIAAEGSRTQLRLVSFTRRPLLADLEAAFDAAPSEQMHYILAAARAEDALAPGTFAQLADAAEFERIALAPPPGEEAAPWLALPQDAPAPAEPPAVETPEPAPQPEPQPEPEPVAEPAPAAQTPVFANVVRRNTLPADGSSFRTLSAANIRSGPSTGSARVDRARAGEELQIVEELLLANGEIWYRLGGDVGYIRSDLVQRVAPGIALERTAPIRGPRAQQFGTEDATPPPAAEPAAAAPLVEDFVDSAPLEIAPEPAAPQVAASDCDSANTVNYRVRARTVPVLDAPAGNQVDTVAVGRFVYGAMPRTIRGHLVFSADGSGTAASCRYVPHDPADNNLIRMQ